MKGTRLLSILLLPLSLVLRPVSAQDGAFPVTGSILYKTGYLGLREEIPDTTTPDWFSGLSAVLRLAREDDASRFRAAIRAEYDMTGTGWTSSLDEAWYEWKPVPFLGVRAGRAPIAYGSCIAFNPANSFSSPDPFDVRTNAMGRDGLFFRLDPMDACSAEASAVSLTLNGAFLLPRSSVRNPVPDLEEGSAHGRIAVLLPESGILGRTEIGVSGDFTRLGGTAPDGEIPAAGGAWLSMDIMGFVLGAEGAIRTPDYSLLSIPGGTVPDGSVRDTRETGFAVSLNRRVGDVFALLEAARLPEDGDWKGFAKIAYVRSDGELSLSGLLDSETRAARTSLEAAWNASDFLSFRAWGTWNRLPERWDPALPALWSAGISLEAFF